MKAFRTIESMLICFTLLGLAGALGTIMTNQIPDILFAGMAVLFFCWGFRLWRKIKSNEEEIETHDAFLWLEALTYSCFVIYPIVKINSHHLDLSEKAEAIIISTYILFPFLGISLALLRLRKDFRN